MKAITTEILKRFADIEKLDFDRVKKIFQSQNQLNQRIQLKEMKKLIERNRAYEANKAKSDIVSNSLKSPVEGVLKKDE